MKFNYPILLFILVAIGAALYELFRSNRSLEK
jgi:hypothetical protein